MIILREGCWGIMGYFRGKGCFWGAGGRKGVFGGGRDDVGIMVFLGVKRVLGA